MRGRDAGGGARAAGRRGLVYGQELRHTAGAGQASKQRRLRQCSMPDARLVHEPGGVAGGGAGRQHAQRTPPILPPQLLQPLGAHRTLAGCDAWRWCRKGGKQVERQGSIYTPWVALGLDGHTGGGDGGVKAVPGPGWLMPLSPHLSLPAAERAARAAGTARPRPTPQDGCTAGMGRGQGQAGCEERVTAGSEGWRSTGASH